MKIDKLLYEHHAELRLRGEFDSFYAPKLIEEVDQLIQSGTIYLVLNLRLVKFINSTALGSMIKAYKRFKAEGGDLCIAEPSLMAKDVLTKVGIDRIVPMFGSSDEAKEYLHTQMKEQGLATVIGESQVLFSPTDPELSAKLGRGVGLGSVLSVDHESIRFLWTGNIGANENPEQLGALFPEGAELNVKFQVKLCKKGFFEILSEVDSVESGETSDGKPSVTVVCRFKELPEADKLALAQFADDLDYLKQQLRDFK
jgi:anti-sigma B factor antagonist